MKAHETVATEANFEEWRTYQMVDADFDGIFAFARRRRLPCVPFSGCIVVNGYKVKTLAGAKVAASMPYAD